MADYLFDTSGLTKHYHSETGTANVDRVLAESTGRFFVSRLTTVELLSAFAMKVRTGVITATDFQQLRQRFYADITRRQLIVVRMDRAYFGIAALLLERHGHQKPLRTLDALQLATALDLRNRQLLDTFICADHSLCQIAVTEGLTVLNPENP